MAPIFEDSASDGVQTRDMRGVSPKSASPSASFLGTEQMEAKER